MRLSASAFRVVCFVRLQGRQGRHQPVALHSRVVGTEECARAGRASSGDGGAPTGHGRAVRLAAPPATYTPTPTSTMPTATQRLEPIRRADRALQALRDGALATGVQPWRPSGVEEIS